MARVGKLSEMPDIFLCWGHGFRAWLVLKESVTAVSGLSSVQTWCQVLIGKQKV